MKYVNIIKYDFYDNDLMFKLETNNFLFLILIINNEIEIIV